MRPIRPTRALAALAVAAAVAGGLTACDDEPAAGAEPAPPATAGAANAATGPVEVRLSAQNGSGVNGVATLRPRPDGRTDVVVRLESGVAASPPRPSHVHAGRCATLDPAPAFGLADVEGGGARSVIGIGIDELVGGDYAINLHRSKESLDEYIACGDIG